MERITLDAVDKKTRIAKQIIDDTEWLNENHTDAPEKAIVIRKGRMYVRKRGLWEHVPVKDEEE